MPGKKKKRKGGKEGKDTLSSARGEWGTELDVCLHYPSSLLGKGAPPNLLDKKGESAEVTLKFFREEERLLTLHRRKRKGGGMYRKSLTPIEKETGWRWSSCSQEERGRKFPFQQERGGDLPTKRRGES